MGTSAVHAVIRRLVDLAPAQQTVTAKIVDSPVVTTADLTSAGIFPPQPKANRPRRRINLDLDEPEHT